ncbi:MAG: DUF3179 domain-containing protein, partial [Actinomycetota bacterium]|nr:DUF3179 domain-containing protein [Actinomycetota bacterium]
MRILNIHEIVNDVVAGRPIVVSFCPLCNSIAGFSGEVDGRTLIFGVSGQLLSSNLVMFDRPQGGGHVPDAEGRRSLRGSGREPRRASSRRVLEEGDR